MNDPLFGALLFYLGIGVVIGVAIFFIVREAVFRGIMKWDKEKRR